MADFYISCPSCKSCLLLDESFVGQQINCPSCEHELTVNPPAVNWTCEHCGAAMAAEAALSGSDVDCDGCGQVLTVPPVATGGPKLTLKKNSPECPSCGVELEEGAVLCVQCGFHLEQGKKVGDMPDDEPEPSFLKKNAKSIVYGVVAMVLMLLAAVIFTIRSKPHTPPKPVHTSNASKNAKKSGPTAKATPAESAAKPEPSEAPVESEPAVAAAGAEPDEPTAEEVAAAEAVQGARAELAEELFSSIYPSPPVAISRSLRVQGTAVEFKGEGLDELRRLHADKEWLTLINRLVDGEYEEWPEDTVIRMAARKLRQYPMDIFIQTRYRHYDPNTKRYLRDKDSIVVAAFNLDDPGTPTFHTIGATRRSSQHNWKIHPRGTGFYKSWNFGDADGLVVFLTTREATLAHRKLAEEFQQQRQHLSGPNREEALSRLIRSYYKKFADVMNVN